jgi:hypothetical protein
VVAVGLEEVEEEGSLLDLGKGIVGSTQAINSISTQLKEFFVHILIHNIKQNHLPIFKMKLAIASLVLGSAAAFSPSAFSGSALKATSSNGSSMDMKYKVAVVGGGPSGACAAEIFAQEKNIDTVLFERKMDNAKPCGGAIPLCMIGEFDIPESTVDRKVGYI